MQVLCGYCNTPQLFPTLRRRQKLPHRAVLQIKTKSNNFRLWKFGRELTSIWEVTSLPRKPQDIQAPTDIRNVNFYIRSLQFESPQKLEYPEVFVAFLFTLFQLAVRFLKHDQKYFRPQLPIYYYVPSEHSTLCSLRY